MREAHRDTPEGVWAGLRNLPRPSRGVNEAYLAQYAAIFARGTEPKRATAAFLRALLGIPPTLPQT